MLEMPPTVWARARFFSLAFVIISASRYVACTAGSSSALLSVPDLEAAMYTAVGGDPCTRLLTLQGEAGCGNPGRGPVAAPIERVVDPESQVLTGRRAVLLSMDHFAAFMTRVERDAEVAEKVVGVMVEQSEGSSFSPAAKFPQPQFAPYRQKDYAWNPLGSGLLEKGYPFPVLFLSNDSAQVVNQRAERNKAKHFRFPLEVAEFDSVMQSTKSSARNTEECLAAYACLPLGGYSVWSALPPLDPSPAVSKPLVVAMAAMDAASFFRDSCPGAESPISGLVALLAAADALSRLPTATKAGLSKQLVFLALDGEAWGYLGGRSFLKELGEGGNATKGLDPTLLHQVLEIGSVGRATAAFYAHESKEEVSPLSAGMVRQLERDAKALGGQVLRPDRATPGVPPSSLIAFLRQHGSIGGVVLTDFDAQFLNPNYNSHTDTLDSLRAESIILAASIASRSLYHLAGGPPTEVPPPVDPALVAELLTCLLSSDPGMTCPLVTGLLTPQQQRANHYTGVFVGAPYLDPPPDFVADTARFVWNFLANRTGERGVGAVEGRGGCALECEEEGEVCVGVRAEKEGECVRSTTRYVASYSTRLEFFPEKGWTLLPRNLSDPFAEADLVWTESYWQKIGFRAYLKEDDSFDVIILGLGVTTFVVSMLGVSALSNAYRQRLKSA